MNRYRIIALIYAVLLFGQEPVGQPVPLPGTLPVIILPQKVPGVRGLKPPCGRACRCGMP